MAKWLRAVLLLTPLAALALDLVVLGVGALLPSAYEVAESATSASRPREGPGSSPDLAKLCGKPSAKGPEPSKVP